MEQEAFVIRPIQSSDLDWLLSLSHKIESGFTSLPHNENFLAHRINIVEQSFNNKIPPEQRVYIFVRENLVSNVKVGIAGIQASAGYGTIFYNYELSTIKQQCRELNIELEHQVLNLVNNFQNASELISFAIDPTLRGKKLGRYLSYSRFLYMAQFPEFFGNEIIAEIRGKSTENGEHPFWEAIGRHFFAMDFETADYLTMSTDKQYIADLMPRNPIYVDMLSKAARESIGVEHTTAGPARHFLESQGFKYKDYVDIFDGGPLLLCDREQITTIKNSLLSVVSKNVKSIENGEDALICNARPNMRSTTGKIRIENSGEVVITNDVAKILDITTGDQLRYCKI